ncbi:unnamed protein product [Caenorhabditis nigoni]|uniref:Protein kinase domain-containing protein n=1 Tax=Caenorhabditis nigoni TaxID=1611254 RepID=A0A2G5SCU9_9PELO|nr:hypothetical protein B9Z55_028230 [Caenorhabditis nigoni]
MKRNQESPPQSIQKKLKDVDDTTQENKEPTSSSAMADKQQSSSNGQEVRKETQLEKTSMSKFPQSPTPITESLASTILSNRQQENSQHIRDMETNKMSPPVDTDDPDWISSKVSTPPVLQDASASQSDTFKSPDLPPFLELQTGEKFIVNGEFGEGVFGIVYFVRGEDNKDYAAKVIKERKNVYLASPEEEAYKRIAANPHENLLLLHLKGLLINPPPTCTPKVFITPACGPSLFDVLNKVDRDLHDSQNATFSLTDIRKIGKQVAQAMHHLETLEIYHLDLKMDNVVFIKDFAYETKSGVNHTVIKMAGTDVKVIDYGNAKFHPQHGEKQVYESVQTLVYRAPEVLLGIPHSVKSDVWSMGCMLIEMYSGEEPFMFESGDSKLEEEQSQLKDIIYTLETTVPEKLLEQSKRGGQCRLDLSFLGPFEEFEAHGIRKLMRQQEDLQLFHLLELMFAVDPSNRISFLEVKGHEFFADT